MLREAVTADAVEIDRFLTPYTETSMFLRGNLADHGVGWSDARHSTRFWIWDQGGIAGVFALTKGGYLMIQCPNAPVNALAAFRDRIVGQTVIGMTGACDQVAAALAALGLKDARFSLLRDEPLYRLSLTDLPVNTAQARPATAQDRPMLETWLADYMIETETAPNLEQAKRQAKTRAAAAPGSTMRLLLRDGVPVAMAALNAQVAGTVQVGGVYVPPDLRGQGLGRNVVIALLSDALAAGAHQAILFAASETAANVYETIGFHKIGTYKLALLADPVRIAAT